MVFSVTVLFRLCFLNKKNSRLNVCLTNNQSLAVVWTMNSLMSEKISWITFCTSRLLWYLWVHNSKPIQQLSEECCVSENLWITFRFFNCVCMLKSWLAWVLFILTKAIKVWSYHIIWLRLSELGVIVSFELQRFCIMLCSTMSAICIVY